ncbi:hypothetical protein J437_LFUL001293 [Ladona fulva]|uniref:Caspase-3 n=1 Tax=Ladona fulva TaxID=123851 RepID=A0A8K0NUA8_LADFU|nr:hypothetical protein J437_LFUL001293 [Ladona fulva]
MDHTNHDCLLVAIMTHGEENGFLYAKDNKYNAEEVWDCFKAVKSLAGKPKIFLFQACRGSKMEERTIIPCGSGVPRCSIIPSNADYLMVYSCIEGTYMMNTFVFLVFKKLGAKGYASWRNTSEGSWFIQDLCKDINEYKDKEDMLSILTHTLRRVAYTRCSNVPTDPDKDGRQEMPVFSSTLTKLLYFYETSH